MTFWRFAVFGDPIDHSLSPAIHQAALAAAGLAGTYEARRIGAAGLASAVDDVRTGRINGANVTMPHKRAAAVLCDEVTADAARAGAVNTLLRRHGGVHGDNTDIAGIRWAWSRHRLPLQPILILGAGGAAAAALLALEGRSMAVSARSPAKAAELIERVGVEAELIPWGTPISGAVIVNATPIGMKGEALPDPVMARASALFDMAYGSAPTPAESEARARGWPVAAGKEMLLGQAAVSFQAWTGHDGSEADMRKAMDAEIQRRSASI